MKQTHPAKLQPELARPEESRELVRQLMQTRLFLKYERSFSAASGLPLSLRPVESFQMPACRSRHGNAFCALMARSRKGCVACLQVQSELEDAARHGTRTQRCYANLHDTMVPLRIGQRVVAFLQTGQVALAPVSPTEFDGVFGELTRRGVEVDDDARAALAQSRTMPKEQYQGFVRMLEIFAETLGVAANALLIAKRETGGSAPVSKSLKYLETRFDQKITLSEIAKVSGASERHFCKVFKTETGLSFVTYLTRMRIESAKKSLRETNQRVSDIAFASGFESIAQFNKSFKSVAGESPSSYRRAATA